MIEKLRLLNIPAHLKKEFSKQIIPAEGKFVLDTCQRYMVLSLDTFESLPQHQNINYLESKDAYFYLLEIICGLQSQLTAESEIVRQFRDAFSLYLAKDQKDKRLIKVIEKLLQDSKKIRTQHLKEIGQKSYAGLVRKLFNQSANSKQRVLVLGSGKLAIDVVQNLKKKFDVSLSARNFEKSKEICKEHNIALVPWQEYSLYKDHHHIVNTIGRDEVLLEENFIQDWNSHESLLICLGSPSPIQSQFTVQDGHYKLKDIMSLGAIRETRKREKIATARVEISKIVDRRSMLFYKEREQWEQKQKIISLEPEEASLQSHNQVLSREA